jgi:predicted DNA-binding transcriptional regulator AlpA
MANIEDVLLTGAEVARILGIRMRELEYWRSRGRGPRFRRLGSKTIRFSRADVDEFIESTCVDPVAPTVSSDAFGNR